MKSKVNELEKILENELLLHGRLLDSARAMNAGLKKEAVDEVRKASRDYDDSVCRIEAIEEDRLSVSDALAAILGLGAHAGLSRVIGALPVRERGRLPELRVNLRSAINEIQKTNIANRVLLTEALFTITKTFEFIAAASEKFKGYKEQGKKHATKVSRAIINTLA
jgi:hypothetical protein